MQVSSPCVRNCCLDEEDICIGCGRAVDEVIRWSDAGNKEKSEILGAAKKRRADRKAIWDGR